MIQTSILDLAVSGDLGSLCHDLSQDELRMLLGSPSDWGTQATQERADIWRYGDIEFHFINRKVYLIFSDHGDMTLANGSLQIDPWILRRGLALEDFESALAEASIPYETIIPGFDPTQRIVTTISGAKFTFTDDPDDEFFFRADRVVNRNTGRTRRGWQRRISYLVRFALKVLRRRATTFNVR